MKILRTTHNPLGELLSIIPEEPTTLTAGFVLEVMELLAKGGIFFEDRDEVLGVFTVLKELELINIESSTDKEEPFIISKGRIKYVE